MGLLLVGLLVFPHLAVGRLSQSPCLPVHQAIVRRVLYVLVLAPAQGKVGFPLCLGLKGQIFELEVLLGVSNA